VCLRRVWPRWRDALELVQWGACRSSRCAPRSGLLLLACVLAGVGIAQAQTTGKVLYNSCAQANCADGGVGVAGLTRDSAGNLYGTTLLGGDGAFAPPGPVGCGAGPFNGHYAVGHGSSE
jgi:hypothetical protein